VKKVIINPQYQYYSDFIESLPEIFSTEGTTIHKGRNEVKIFHAKGIDLVVKSFKIPHFINKIAYSFFRLSKARRSYEYALILKEKKINTPDPIAYIEIKQNGLFSQSYYISVYEEYPTLMREFRYHPLEGKEDLVQAFAQFTAYIHNQEILHLDYSSGNVLCKENETGYEFYLVDINRMKFGEVDMKSGCYNFRRLWGSDEMIVYMAGEYAKSRGFNEDECAILALKYHREFWKKYSKKHGGFKPYLEA
jgi:tRNA A-37 threonylcarbamoyl transferase component Bud32